MNSTAYEELFELLTAAGDLTDPDRELVLAAAEGAASLSALLAGDASPATLSPESADAGVASAPLATKPGKTKTGRPPPRGARRSSGKLARNAPNS